MYSIETVKNVLTLNIPLSYEAEKKESSIHTFKRHLFILAEHEMANLAGLIHGNDRRWQIETLKKGIQSHSITYGPSVSITLY